MTYILRPLNYLLKATFLFAFIAIISFSSLGQGIITPADKKILQQKEDTLKRLAKNLIIDSIQEGRMRSDSIFIRALIRTLQVRNS
ncbi:MAG: hypothetical protein JSS70_05940, partial [Bacteroidetes bacterium]|nr:hypothetical protein [Bacteroidota bacterium]